MSVLRANATAITVTLAAFGYAIADAAPRVAPDRLPERLADSTFWRMVTTFSEESGFFSSENFVSNETEWQYVIPGALQRVQPMSAYLGVGPEQNFTYIAAFQPRIAFITDIRRQNLVQHLMYKALMETSSDRVDFLAKLWSRKRPEGLDSSSTPAQIVDAFRAVAADSLHFTFNLGGIFHRLVNERKFVLSSEDSATMRAVYGTFFAAGPDISYSTSSRRGGDPFRILGPGPAGSNWTRAAVTGTSTGFVSISVNGSTTTYRITTDSAGRQVVMRDSAGTSVPDTTFQFQRGGTIGMNPMPFFGGLYATFASLMTEEDGAGVNRGWLGSESAFQRVRDYQMRNMIVPIVGDFGGPKALRSVGEYLASHGARVSAFYTSNVEQYLFQRGLNGAFYDNVAALPSDSTSIFIRSFPSTVRGAVMPRRSGSRLAQTTSSIDSVLRSHKRGELRTYTDLAWVQDR